MKWSSFEIHINTNLNFIYYFIYSFFYLIFAFELNDSWRNIEACTFIFESWWHPPLPPKKPQSLKMKWNSFEIHINTNLDFIFYFIYSSLKYIFCFWTKWFVKKHWNLYIYITFAHLRVLYDNFITFSSIWSIFSQIYLLNVPEFIYFIFIKKPVVLREVYQLAKAWYKFVAGPLFPTAFCCAVLHACITSTLTTRKLIHDRESSDAEEYIADHT